MTTPQDVKAIADSIAAKTGQAPDYFCLWGEVYLRRFMDADAKAINKANERRLSYELRSPGTRPAGHTHIGCKNAMRDIGRPCTRKELEEALDVKPISVRKYLNELIRKDEVTTDRNEAGEVVYILKAGYSQKEMEL